MIQFCPPRKSVTAEFNKKYIDKPFNCYNLVELKLKPALKRTQKSINKRRGFNLFIE